MSGIKIALSSPEAVHRLHDLAESLLKIHGGLTRELRQILVRKAEELDVHLLDLKDIVNPLSPRSDSNFSGNTLLPAAGEEWVDPVTGMVFLWIPQGCFQMGSPKSEIDRTSDEEPVHEVIMDGFWMGKFAVTNMQYRRFRNEHDSGVYKGFSLNSENQPVVEVSWQDAQAFAAWLTDRNAGVYSFTLPTESQWEYACRSGTMTSRFWGEIPDQGCAYANVYDIAKKKQFDFIWPHHNYNTGHFVTASVGSFQPNPFGLYDMLGNVWEWCEDVYSFDAYRKHPRNNPLYTDTDYSNGQYRVLRGGSWHDSPAYVRCANRVINTPDSRSIYIGFRLVRML